MNLRATALGETHTIEIQRTDGRYTVTIDGETLDVDCLDAVSGSSSLIINGASYDAQIESRASGYLVELRGGTYEITLADASPTDPAHHVEHGPFVLKAPMPGKVVRLLVEVGQAVQSSQGLVVVEAMKMENELRAPRAGTVQKVHVREGQAVEAGAPLVAVD